MSNRLDQQREAELQPKRMEYATQQLEALGHKVSAIDINVLQFVHNGHTITFWPYSGWHTGKSIKDGRGIKKLLRQLI